MTTTTTNFIICALLLLCSTTARLLVRAEDDNLQSKCSEDFTKVASCLTFVSAKASQPTKECCTSVTQIRKDDPVCLCFFIQMASNGSAEQVKSLGVKVSQLLLLPSACKLANSNISDCPTLLGLPANSPAAKVFTNLTTPTTPSTEGTTTTVPTTTTSSRDDTSGSADGLNHVAAFLVAITVAVSMSLVFVLA